MRVHLRFSIAHPDDRVGGVGTGVSGGSGDSGCGGGVEVVGVVEMWSFGGGGGDAAADDDVKNDDEPTKHERSKKPRRFHTSSASP